MRTYTMARKWAIEGEPCTGPLGGGFEAVGFGRFYHGGSFAAGPPVRVAECVAVRIASVDLTDRPQRDMPQSVLYPAILRRVFWGRLGRGYMWMAGVEWIVFKDDIGAAASSAGGWEMRSGAAAVLQMYSDVPLACIEG